MRKLFLFISIFFLMIGVVSGEGIQDISTGPASQMDSTVREAAQNIHRKLNEVKAQKVAFGQISYRGTVPPLSAYWMNQLTNELTNMSNRSYIILSGGQAGADMTIAGEIVDVSGVIRVFIRLIRSENRAIEGAFQSDFERTGTLIAMLSGADSGGGGGGGRSSSSLPMDEWEPDSFENPVTYEIGADESAPVMNRNIHSGEDEDFFLLIPADDGQLTAETTGSTDTYMEFYDAETRELLAQDDDGGSGYNARIRYNVTAGKRYIAKVRGCDRSDTGNYGFRAYLRVVVRIEPDEFEPDDEPSNAKWIEIGTPQQHTFHSSDDVDWVKFQITNPGRYTIRTRGINSNRLDTYIELYDENLNLIGEDDDGGENLDSKLTVNLNSGLYYLQVECFNEPDQPYTISIDAE